VDSGSCRQRISAAGRGCEPISDGRHGYSSRSEECECEFRCELPRCLSYGWASTAAGLPVRHRLRVRNGGGAVIDFYVKVHCCGPRWLVHVPAVDRWTVVADKRDIEATARRMIGDLTGRPAG